MKHSYLYFLSLLFAVITLTCSPTHKQDLNNNEIDRLIGADAVIQNFTAQGFRDSGPVWGLQAKQGYVFTKEKTTHLFDVSLQYFQTQDGKTTVTCDETVMNEKEQTLLLTGNVIVKSANGRVLYAQELLWREKEQLLVSEKPVKITMPSGDVIQGNALTADNRLNRLTLKAGRGFHPMSE